MPLIIIFIYAIKWVGIGLYYVLKYTWPIILIILGCAVASSIGESSCDGKYRLYATEQISEMTHTVQIVWYGDVKSEIHVREDIDWNIAGMNSNNGLYDNDVSSSYYYPSINIKNRDGYKFKGLFSMPDGNGVQFVNAAGYSMHSIEYDLILYAHWEVLK